MTNSWIHCPGPQCWETVCRLTVHVSVCGCASRFRKTNPVSKNGVGVSLILDKTGQTANRSRWQGWWIQKEGFILCAESFNCSHTERLFQRHSGGTMLSLDCHHWTKRKLDFYLSELFWCCKYLRHQPAWGVLCLRPLKRYDMINTIIRIQSS